MTDALSKFKGPYRAEGMYVRDADGVSVIIVPCQGDPASDLSLAIALANRLNEADAMEKACRALLTACHESYPSLEGRDDEYIYDTLGSAMSRVYFAARDCLPALTARLNEKVK